MSAVEGAPTMSPTERLAYAAALLVRAERDGRGGEFLSTLALAHIALATATQVVSA